MKKAILLTILCLAITTKASAVTQIGHVTGGGVIVMDVSPSTVTAAFGTETGTTNLTSAGIVKEGSLYYIVVWGGSNSTYSGISYAVLLDIDGSGNLTVGAGASSYRMCAGTCACRFTPICACAPPGEEHQGGCSVSEGGLGTTGQIGGWN